MKKLSKVKHAVSRNGRRETDEDSTSDFGEVQDTLDEDDIKKDKAVKVVVKALEKEGLYKYERKERCGHQKTVDYANNVVKHTAKFIVYVGGDELLNLPIISVIIVMSIIKVIIKKLHVSVVDKYCDYLSDKGFASSKQVSNGCSFVILCNIIFNIIVFRDYYKCHRIFLTWLCVGESSATI